MSDPSSTPKRRQPSAEILRFLDDHRLDHTPDHYASAHRYLFGNDRALEAGVQAIIDGGVRISPAEVEKLGAAVTPEPENDVAPQLDQVTVRVLDIIRDTLDATGGLNRDLVKASAALLADDAPVEKFVLAVLALHDGNMLLWYRSGLDPQVGRMVTRAAAQAVVERYSELRRSKNHASSLRVTA